MDRLQCLRVFQAVVDSGGFAAAARQLDLSAPTVTRMVADLEATLGVQLLHRTTRRVSLTEEGARYLERVRRILADLDEADADIAQRSRTVAGTLRVLSTPVLASVLVAPLVPALLQHHPQLRLELDVQAYALPAVEEHDVALFVAEPSIDTALIARRIASGVSALVAAPTYLAQTPALASPADLVRHALLRYRPPGQRSRAWRLWRLDQRGDVIEVTAPGVVASNHIESLLAIALGGAGVLSVSLDLVADRLAAGELVRVLPQWVTDEWSLYAALPARRHVPLRTRAFLEALQARMGALLSGSASGR